MSPLFVGFFVISPTEFTSISRRRVRGSQHCSEVIKRCIALSICQLI